MASSVSPIPWTGNKGCIYPTIEAFMPPHHTYVEPCMGSGEVFFRKKPVPKEILNDYNGDLVHFMRVLQNNENLSYLLGRLWLSFSSEELFRVNKEYLDGIPNILDDLEETSRIIQKASWDEIQRAACFLEKQVFSFSSTGKSFGIAQKDMTKRFPRLVAACARLKNAVILHRDYKDALSYAAGPGVFAFVDPPYRFTTGFYQKSNFTDADHKPLFEFLYSLNVLHEGTFKFILTYNNDPYIRELAAAHGFDTYIKPRLHNMAQGSKPGELFEEILIANYPLVAQAEANQRYLDDVNAQMTIFDQ